MTKLYREFATQEEIDAAYNPPGTVADPDAMFRGWFERSAATVAELPCRLGVQYGPTRAEHCDVFPAGEGAPIHLFIHGGYWRRFSARDHAFVARPLCGGRHHHLGDELRAVPERHAGRDRAADPGGDRLGLRARRRVRRRSQPPDHLRPLGRRASGRHGTRPPTGPATTACQRTW